MNVAFLSTEIAKGKIYLPRFRRHCYDSMELREALVFCFVFNVHTVSTKSDSRRFQICMNKTVTCVFVRPFERDKLRKKLNRFHGIFIVEFLFFKVQRRRFSSSRELWFRGKSKHLNYYCPL